MFPWTLPTDIVVNPSLIWYFIGDNAKEQERRHDLDPLPTTDARATTGQCSQFVANAGMECRELRGEHKHYVQPRVNTSLKLPNICIPL